MMKILILHNLKEAFPGDRSSESADRFVCRKSRPLSITRLSGKQLRRSLLFVRQNAELHPHSKGLLWVRNLQAAGQNACK